MAYILGGNTLPTPQGFTRKQIETSQVIQLLDGTTKKDIINRKEQYILEFRMLTQLEAGGLLRMYFSPPWSTKSFVVTESNLTINTTVHLEIRSRQYNTRGDEYREDITITLTEVI